LVSGVKYYFTLPRNIVTIKDKPDMEPMEDKTIKKVDKNTISYKVDMLLDKVE
jgi:hypothetical protein